MRALVCSLVLLAGCVAPAAVAPTPDVAALLPIVPGLHAIEIDVAQRHRDGGGREEREARRGRVAVVAMRASR